MRFWDGAHMASSVGESALLDRVTLSGLAQGTSLAEGGKHCSEAGLHLDAPWRPKKLWQMDCA